MADSTMSEKEAELHEAVGALRHYATTPRCDSNMMGAIDIVCRAALRATSSGWRTMESAPKDATTVVLCTTETSSEYARVRLGYWTRYGKSATWYSVDDDRPVGITPTHWMPVPPPPAEPEDGK
jgi:hypothetical protein